MKYPDGADVRSDKGDLPQYDKKRASKNDWTVKEWKQKCFTRKYPGFDIDVLDGDGNSVIGHTKLGTVRDSYNEDDDEEEDE